MDIRTSQATAVYLTEVLAAANATNANPTGNATQNPTQSLFPNGTPTANLPSIFSENPALAQTLANLPTLQSVGLPQESGSMNAFLENVINKPVSQGMQEVKKPQKKEKKGGGGVLDFVKRALPIVAKIGLKTVTGGLLA